MYVPTMHAISLLPPTSWWQLFSTVFSLGLRFYLVPETKSGQHIKENESPSSFPSILFYPSIYIGGQLGKLIYAHEYTYITAYYSIYLNRILKSDFYDGTQSTVFYFTFFMYKLTSFFILKKSLFMILHYLMVQITQ